MSSEDVALCQEAIKLANSGQKQAAYKQFCLIHSHGNAEDVTLLYWIAATTPSPVEAQRAIDTIARIEPDHPKLPALQAYLDRKRPLSEGEYPDRFSSTSLSQTKKSHTWLWIMLGIATVLVCSCVSLIVVKETTSTEATPYPWNVTINSGYTRETTWAGAPIGATKNVSLSVTLENVSNDIQYPSMLQWMLTDKNGTITGGTATGFLNAQVIQPGQSFTEQLSFQVPIAEEGWTLSLTSPAGTDPTTWNIP